MPYNQSSYIQDMQNPLTVSLYNKDPKIANPEPTNSNFIITEDGNFIITEDGNFIITED